jgi:ubiquinone/menaquinone biosynthesis C-methylase UbiE
MMRNLIHGLCLRPALLFLAAGFLLWGSAPNAYPQQDAGKLPPPREEYKGRRIAETMSYHGAPWLVRETRDKEEHPRKLIEALQVKKGQTVADVGCGNGFYSLQLAKLVGPEGRVLAVDIQPEMLELLKQRADEAGIDNIEPILSTQADPKLPPGEVDLILLVDVYHEFSYPDRMLQAMRASLSRDGRIALAEYRMEDPAVPIKLLHKMSKQQILSEYTANGLKLAGAYDGLPWQHLMFFGRAE